MTSTIIISLCILVLIAYLFDLSSSKTKIPSVILLLVSGGLVRFLTDWLGIQLPDLDVLLPVLGTVGLILIVMEGSLELQLHRSRLPMIFKSFMIAFIPLILLSCLAAWGLQYLGYPHYKTNLGNVIPLFVISSAIAIPSVRHNSRPTREFVVYETSLSDILGVIFFNFIVLNEFIDQHAFFTFFMQLGLETLIAFIATLFLAFLLGKIEHHIKFVPIIFLIILIYAVSKELHLPALLFILIFGLFLGNLDELRNFKWIAKFHPENLDREVIRFKEITTEATFLIRSLFFLVFGYLIRPQDIINQQSAIWAACIVAAVYIVRIIILKLFRMGFDPLLYIAPRGLITILLFLSIPAETRIPIINNSLVVQVMLLTVLIMMVGLMFSKEKSKEDKAAREAEVRDSPEPITHSTPT
ncbi:MAG TPA: cation:proton antiporter [Saprospiraceae bacterium]|nr:cation:proton antiporter [Saprospiraceae bacterium]